MKKLIEEDLEEDEIEEKKKTYGKKRAKKNNRIKGLIIFLISLIFSLVAFLSFFGQSGVVGSYLQNYLGNFFGFGKWLIPFIVIKLGWDYFQKQEEKKELFWLEFSGAGLGVIFLATFLHLFAEKQTEMMLWAEQGLGGGYLGFGLAFGLEKYLGKIASFILSFGLMFVGIVLFLDLSFSFSGERFFNFLKGIKNIFIWMKTKFVFRGFVHKKIDKEISMENEEKKESETLKEELTENIKNFRFDDDPIEEENLSDDLEITEAEKRERKKIKKNIKWNLPKVDLLDKETIRKLPKNLEINAHKIKETLRHFGIAVEPSGHNFGPTVVQYTFKPAAEVKLSKILAYQSNLALSLEAHSLRIEAPIPGKSLVGVEIPLAEKDRVTVKLRSALESEIFKTRNSKNLTIVLGEDVNGDLILGDLGKMPHLMIAGATGTGKSVCINSILLSLLYQNSPEDLGLVLVDPKRVELTFYKNIPHLLAPVVVEASRAVGVLNWAVIEMSKRLKLLEEAGSKDIYSYNKKVSKGKIREVLDEKTKKYQQESFEKMKFIVIVIDEMADLMITQGKQVEKLIVRLAQLARAVGIHLIISTQKPSVEAITSLIKSNINTRIAFRVSNNMDSRIILDKSGAEKLLGRGDMLYSSVESMNLKRIQGVFVSEEEVERVVKYYENQAKKNGFVRDDGLTQSLDENVNQSLAKEGLFDQEEEKDEMYEAAKQVILEKRRASTTFLQKELKIGYPRASSLMDLLEQRGVISGPSGSKARQILIGSEEAFLEEDKLSENSAKDNENFPNS